MPQQLDSYIRFSTMGTNRYHIHRLHQSSKAFDSVPYRRLLFKLQRYGIRGKVQEWIKFFLTERYQRVVINGTPSSFNKVTSGVLQGTIIGPILFLLYINDMPRYIQHSHISLFAYDANVFKRIIYHNDQNQHDLNALGSWQSDWLLHCNPAKCSTIQVRNKFDKQYYIKTRKGEKDLGVTITFRPEVINPHNENLQTSEPENRNDPQIHHKSHFQFCGPSL